ncbi:hypothetical protein Syun_023727 [Stephania yunnanensis]|uniref:Uncharacterized protein n=1 Tax=Stephania yunnanensis TaxID=152371 RepID=A0AAP0I3H4_9MAGN
MADALSVIFTVMLRNLSDKLYEKRKNEAQEVFDISRASEVHSLFYTELITVAYSLRETMQNPKQQIAKEELDIADYNRLLTIDDSANIKDWHHATNAAIQVVEAHKLPYVGDKVGAFTDSQWP